MTLHAVTMPKWGLSMQEGKIVHWYAQEGQLVSTGADLVDIETSKITNTVEAAGAGRLCRIVAQLDDTLPCGQLIAVLDDADASDAEIDAFVVDAASRAEALAAAEPAAPPEPAFVDVSSGRVRYLKLGEGDTPFVLIHGFGGDLNNWLFQQDALAADRAVYAIDLPGHGGSTKNVQGGDVVALAGAMAEALAALSITRAHLVGHSLGGAVALELAKRPGLAASLSLIAPAGLGADINGGYIAGFLGAKRRRDMQAALGALFSDATLVTADMAEDLLKARRLDGAEDALKAIAEAAFDGDRQRVDQGDALNALVAPPLVIWGAEDKIIPAAHAARAAEAIILPKVGHMPHLEAAAEVASAVRRHAAAAGG